MVRNAVRRKEEAEDNEKHPFVWDKWLAKLAGPAGKADKLDLTEDFSHKRDSLQ